MKKLLIGFLFTFLLAGCTQNTQISKKVIDSKDPISEEEQVFYDSGRAKAIEKESDLWQFFESPEADFSFRYPHNVSREASESTRLFLSIDTKAIAEMEEFAPLGFGSDMALKNKEALARGEYGEGVDFSLPASQTVRNLGAVNAQDFMVLGRFEVCDKVLERKLYFFHKEHQVVITLEIPRERVASAIPELLVTNFENCGEERVWDFGKQPLFYTELVAGNGEEAIQEWFDTFEQIVETIEFF
jgi:hypothetical protein